MILVNTETLPGYEIVEVKKLAQGNAVMAKHVGRDIGASLKNLVGGELRAYTELLADARETASSRMVADAEQAGATAIVNIRYTTSAVAGTAAELYAYGTAVTIRPI
jgi:uncharacterized protein YbjQ (UPF0145 family)